MIGVNPQNVRLLEDLNELKANGKALNMSDSDFNELERIIKVIGLKLEKCARDEGRKPKPGVYQSVTSAVGSITMRELKNALSQGERLNERLRIAHKCPPHGAVGDAALLNTEATLYFARDLRQVLERYRTMHLLFYRADDIAGESVTHKVRICKFS